MRILLEEIFLNTKTFELSSSVERDCEESFMQVWSLDIVTRNFHCLEILNKVVQR